MVLRISCFLSVPLILIQIVALCCFSTTGQTWLFLCEWLSLAWLTTSEDGLKSENHGSTWWHINYIYTYIKLYTTYITWKVRPHVFGLPKHHPKYPIKTAARGALRSTPRCKDVDLMDVGSLFQDLFSLENADYKQKKMLHVWNIYIWTIFGVNVGKYSIHGASGTYWSHG